MIIKLTSDNLDSNKNLMKHPLDTLNPLSLEIYKMMREQGLSGEDVESYEIKVVIKKKK